eukprot:3083823-Prymnesium_polylepis.1
MMLSLSQPRVQERGAGGGAGQDATVHETDPRDKYAVFNRQLAYSPSRTPTLGSAHGGSAVRGVRTVNAAKAGSKFKLKLLGPVPELKLSR